MARIACMTDERFDDADVREPCEKLRAAGHDVMVIGREARLPVIGLHGEHAVLTQIAARNACVDEFDALLIAGGDSADRLCCDSGAVALAASFVSADKLVAAPGAAVGLLIAADVVRDRVVTSCPELRCELEAAGGRWVARELVADGNLVTSQRGGAGSAIHALVSERLGRVGRATPSASDRSAGSARAMWSAALLVGVLTVVAPVLVSGEAAPDAPGGEAAPDAPGGEAAPDAPGGDAARDARAAAAELPLESERNTVEVFEHNAQSVVSVEVNVAGQSVGPLDGGAPDPLRDLLPPSPEPLHGAGSGFIVDEAGHILTNYHVVLPALERGSTRLAEGARVQVRFAMFEKPIPARVIGANALYDLALLELEAESVPQAVRELAPLELGRSAGLIVGQKTIAIGNPFGFASTVTTGIVSGIGRSLPGLGQVDIPLVQTDAAINPGSSGGPLLDSSGRVIGINSAIVPGLLAESAGFVGLGFAVPVDLVRETLPALVAGELTDVTTRARLGIAGMGVDAYPEAVRESMDLPETGVAVAAVEPNSPAADAGLRGAQFEVMAEGISLPGGMDVIVAIDGEDIVSPNALQQVVFEHEEGDVITLVVFRDGERREVELKLRVFAGEDVARRR
jgi:serine protease Do